jgi:mono/diheme cytochrome c family protein
MQAAVVAVAALCALAAASPAAAQDNARGRELFVNTRGATGKPVGNCIACHANIAALREMIRNRGGKPDDVVSVRRVLQRAIDGAQPGAAGVKAQYRGAVKAKDLDDLAAYIVQAKVAAAHMPMIRAGAHPPPS